MIDVRLLLEDSDTKSAALDKMTEMELELSYVRRLWITEGSGFSEVKGNLKAYDTALWQPAKAML